MVGSESELSFLFKKNLWTKKFIWSQIFKFCLVKSQLINIWIDEYL